MRVLLTTDVVGGVWTFTRELTMELLNRGHSVALLTFGGDLDGDKADWADGVRRRFSADFRLQITNVHLEWMPLNEHVFEYGAKFLSPQIEAFRPDILHTNQFCYGALPEADPSNRALRLPRVVTAHSDVLSWGEACRRDGFEPSPWLERYMTLVRSGLAGADAVTAPTKWMADRLRHHFPVGPSPEVILNGRALPAHNLLTQDRSSSSRKLQAATAGRLWDEGKNTIMLAEIESPIPLYIAGEAEFDRDVLFTSAPLRNAVLSGCLNERDVLALFKQSSLYIVTSRYEPFGLAPLEAALCGCAVLANDIPSLREVWGDAALYFRTPRELEDLLRHLRDHPDQLKKARERSTARALELTPARMADAYIALYQRLLDARSTSTGELTASAV